MRTQNAFENCIKLNYHRELNKLHLKMNNILCVLTVYKSCTSRVRFMYYSPIKMRKIFNCKFRSLFSLYFYTVCIQFFVYS